MKFYAKVTKSQCEFHREHGFGLRYTPYGSGYVVINATSREDACQKMFSVFGPKWSFLYETQEQIHEWDRYPLWEIP